MGLLVDSYQQPAWIIAIIDDIQKSSVATISLVVRNSSPGAVVSPRGSTAARLSRWYAHRHSLLFALYERLDLRKFATDDDPIRMMDATSVLASVPTVEVTPRETKFSDYFNDADVERILAYDLDVALRFGFRILRGRSLRIARYGVWSYHHGDNLANRGGPPGFWEVIEQVPTTGSVLQILSEDLDAGRVIYRSQARTQPLSVTKNRAGYFWKTSEFVIRKLRDLHEDGESALVDPEPTARHPQAYSNRLYLAPKNGELAPHLGRLVSRYAGAKLRDLTIVDQWALAYRFGSKTSTDHVPDLAPFRFKWIVPPIDRFWADPFPMQIDGRFYVLFEELKFRAPKGTIRGFELGEQGMIGDTVPVLECDYHLSYPYTFEWRGDRYMIPESVANRTVQLYRAVKAPYEWTLERVMLTDVRLVDASVVEIEGRWWMFAGTVSRGGSRCDELNVYYADSPLGPWCPHRKNPVISNVRHARPAGRPFQVGDTWYRPAQDCSHRYGWGVTLRRIVRLDPSEFVEETVTTLTPDWHRSVLATHTVNAVNGLTVIDMELRRRKAWLGG
ncbi:MAG TPA: hypothetical protein VIK41_15455 [Gemmatimonadaceae bacterium]